MQWIGIEHRGDDGLQIGERLRNVLEQGRDRAKPQGSNLLADRALSLLREERINIETLVATEVWRE